MNGTKELAFIDGHFVETLPEYVNGDVLNIPANALKVLSERYLWKGNGDIETPAGMFYRVAYSVANGDIAHGGTPSDAARTAVRFYHLLASGKFLPNSPTFTGAGTPLGQLAACFVLPLSDDMGKEEDGIFSILNKAVLIQQTGGGNGFPLGNLRPKGDRVQTSGGKATGPIGFLRVYDAAFGEVAQGGTRRGANMAVMPISHPDVADFITCKSQEGSIANFNISLAITDDFMRAVKGDLPFDLVNPRDGTVWKTVQARYLFDLIVENAHRNGEPGMLFIDTANASNPVPHLYTLEATNPCLAPETLVHTKEGDVPIKDLVGKTVDVWDGESWRSIDNFRVTAVHQPILRITFKSGKTLRVTPYHLMILANGIEMPASSLLEGDQLMPNSSPLAPTLYEGDNEIVSIERDGVEAEVYCCTVEWTHRFALACGVMVGNCGEQWLGPYENCCLGSINLAKHVYITDEGKPVINWADLTATIMEATKFLDNVVTVNAYVPSVPELKQAGHAARRIGLGIMGLADMMFHLGIRYGSEEGQELAAQVMEFVRYHAMNTSISLAERLGPFPAFKGSVYDKNHWEIPTPITPYRRDFGRPSLDWHIIKDRLNVYGIRNAAQTTIAPTGTLATVVGVEGYGCEPAFALGYVRHFKNGDEDVELHYTSPLFEKALNATRLSDERKQAIKEHVALYGSCQEISDLPRSIRDTFVVSANITAQEHVRMQAALQAFIDNSISKTCNFPEGATTKDVAEAYMLAWELGCKGLTVYVTGSRQQVVLETKATKAEKDVKVETPEPLIINGGISLGLANPVEIKIAPVGIQIDPLPRLPERQRPAKLHGSTYRQDTPLGKAYITINSDEEGQPFEVFLNIGKAGSETSALSEALGRLMSFILRMSSDLTATQRLSMVEDMLRGIGGGRPFGFGAKRVTSLADAIGKVLSQHLAGDAIATIMELEIEAQSSTHAPTPALSRITADLCPECGEASFMNIEGCRKCHACGYSEC